MCIGTVPITSNLTHSCESLASDFQLTFEYVFMWKGWWSCECVFLCMRGMAGGIASTCLSVFSRDTSPSLRADIHALVRPPAFPRAHTKVVCWDTGIARMSWYGREYLHV